MFIAEFLKEYVFIKKKMIKYLLYMKSLWHVKLKQRDGYN